MKHLFKFVLILVFASMLTLKLYSEEFNPENLPTLLGTSNAGTEFYLTFHPCWEETGPNNAIKIYVSSNVETKVTLEIEGLMITKTKTTIPNDVIEFSLKPQEAQMYSKGNGGLPIPPQPSQVWAKRAIHITSEDPIVVYGVTRYQYTSDGFLALPVHLLGKEYQVASYADPTNNTSQFLPSYTSIVAIYDNTKVTFQLGGTESSKALFENMDTLKFGQTKKSTMFTGDVWLIAGIGGYNDLTGSTIKSNKPVALISGNFCAYVPVSNSACDFIIEQEIPTNYWSNEIVVPSIIGRKKYPVVKVFANEPATKISRNGKNIGEITTAGGLAGNGYLEIRSDTITTGEIKPVVISGDKPINVVLYNPGMSEDGVSSDPFQMQLFPESLHYKEMTFNTPGIKGGFGFKTNYLCIIFKNSEQKIPDGLEYAKVENGVPIWQQVESALFVKNGSNYYGQATIKLPEDGIYKARNSQPIMCYAYGYSEYDSYGFPAGAVLVEDVNKADTTKPTINIAKQNETSASGYINDTQSGIEGTEVAFSSNLGMVMLLKSESENVNFTRNNFVSGETTSADWNVELVNLNKPGHAVIFASDRAGNTRIIKVELAGVETLAYATMTIQSKNAILRLNQQYQDSVSITNNSDLKTYTISEIYLKNASTSGFTLIDAIKDLVLLSKETKQLNYKFVSNNYGKYADTLMVKYSDGTIKVGTILKAEVIKLIYTGSTLDYGKVKIGSKKSNSLTLVNQTAFPISFMNFKPYASTAFKIKMLNFPFILEPNKQLYVEIEFTPTEVKEYSEVIEFETDADENGKLTVTGTGFEEPKSVDENEENNVKIINLDNNIISINANSTIDLVRIIDISGKLVQQYDSNANQISINIENLPSAIYFIEIKTNGKIIRKNISKVN